MEIYTLAIDDLNEEEFASHGVTPREVLQVLDGPYRVFVNEGAQNAPYVMVGPTHGGPLLNIPIDPTPEHGDWRPRTAYDAPPKDVTRYKK